jgi:predicted GNAT family acetyltransferase
MGDDAITIQHREDPGGGAFLLMKGGEQVGELFYTTRAPDVAVVEHTEVDPELRGAGLGLRLVEAAVAWARATHHTIDPVCPFARKVLRERRDLANVRASHR